ncbi:hypothetical protein GCM10007973_23640 [Polymorphobacter multimanifer]|uniref:PqqD family peptide modification chaperone n=1 Tax=Polymorphobacter multimanifer TaxID=1070431 RepID=UPI0016651346|nr:PqqD family peptide modification chaperone [Polymorphobacter multimanifer]GGI86375.1 hypothetical protein GCM10007973_23640 [Polymorphobacter multimanifer]
MIPAARPDFTAVLRAANLAFPERSDSLQRLMRYLLKTDRLEELACRAGDASAMGAAPELAALVGEAALAMGDPALADTALAHAVAAGQDASLGLRAKALFELGQRDAARDAATLALENQPDDDAAALVMFGLMLSDGRRSDLWALCNDLRARGRWTARMVSALAFAATTPAQAERVRAMTDGGRWIARSTPAGIDAADIKAQLDAVEDWRPLPRTKATKGSGRRLEALHMLASAPALDLLFAAVEDAVADYVRTPMAALDGDHPLVALKPDTIAIRSWALGVRGDGHEDWHLHPDGWLSGVYYVDVPQLSASPAPNAGQIEFGPLPLAQPAPDLVWPPMRLTPRTGDLLLFPSYLAHRTWPTGLSAERLCISFDILRHGCDVSEVGVKPRALTPRRSCRDRYARNPAAVIAPGGPGMHVVMNVESGRYLVVDDTAELAWCLLETPRTTDEIAHVMASRFDGALEESRADMAALLEALFREDLISSVQA